MGSPVSPLLANLFMEWLEKQAIATAPIECKPKFWKRYVDDVLELIKKGQVRNLTDHINTIDPTGNIKFTYEEEDKQIPFLDTLLVRREDGSVKLLVYRKKSHTDQYLNFGSHHPLNHKLAVIRTLLDRCYSIVTEEDDRKKKEEHVAKALSKCGYPPWTIDRIKQDIMEKSLKDETKKVKTTRGNYKGMVVVPYVKGLSEAFARILKSHGIATANRPHRTLRNFVVHPKDKVKDEEKTELIYRISCNNCSSSYIGETGRKFGLRTKEHKKEVDSFTAGTQTEPPGQGRAV